MKSNKAVKGLIFVGGVVVSLIVLSGCGVYALPDNQKLRRVNPIVDQVNYESAGKVVSTEYTG